MFDGGPAFPIRGAANDEDWDSRFHGMSLRDWFAGSLGESDEFNIPYSSIIQVKGIGPSPTGSYHHDGSWKYEVWYAKVLAVWRYMRADAMIERRSADSRAGQEATPNQES